VRFIDGNNDMRYYQYIAIDDCTRLRVLKIYEYNNQKTAIQFIDYALSRLPFRAEVVQTDNVLSLESSSFSG
jgi:transposase-like protein